MASELTRLTILTGATGCGKTTFLCQYSLDFCLKGVPTLWCSFELKNEVVLASMVRQLAGEELSGSDKAFDYWADHLERLPMYFQTFFGSTDIKRVLNLIDYSIYAYNVTHIILDNLQFMLSGQGKGFERFELQDDLISQLRTIATERNVHITLVIHPKKTDDGQDLSVSSIFGTSKATQEADNIFIIQNRASFKLLDIKKNRYDGEVGRVGLLFNRDNKKFETITNDEAEKLMTGADPRSILKGKSRDMTEEITKIIETNFGSPSRELKLPTDLKTAGDSLASGDMVVTELIAREPPASVEEQAPTEPVKAVFEPLQMFDTAPTESPREPSPVEIAIQSVYNHDEDFPADSLALRGYHEHENFSSHPPTEDVVSFDEHFQSLETLAQEIPRAEVMLEAPQGTSKWTRGADSSVSFFVDQAPVMTYEDIMNEYVNKKAPRPKPNKHFNRRSNNSEMLYEEYLSNTK